MDKVKIKKEPFDLKYKGKCIKMHEDTWTKLKDKRKKSGLSWNRYLLKLIKNENENNKLQKVQKRTSV